MWSVCWWSDPVVLGKYPDDGLKLYNEYLPEITDENMKLISQPIDFYGQNIYNGWAIQADDKKLILEDISYGRLWTTLNGLWDIRNDLVLFMLTTKHKNA